MAIFPKENLYGYNNRPHLFLYCLESQTSDKVPFFSLNQEDGYKGTMSLRKLFVELTVEDPTETVFAETVFGSLKFWMDVREGTWLQGYLKDWRKEADIRRKAMAFKSIINEVKTGSRSAFTAAKFLIDEPWLTGASVSEKKALAKRKEETSTEAAEQSKAVEDFKRLTQKAN